MANPDLLNLLVRKEIIKQISLYENLERKKESLKDFDIYKNKIYNYVYDELKKQLSEKTAQTMPVVSTINLSDRIVSAEACIYSDPPKRTFTDLSDEDSLAIEELYEDCAFDTKMQKANKDYKRRGQAFVQVIPKYGKVILRILQGHHVDVIPDEQDPEKAYAYLISAFDYNTYKKSDGLNQTIADKDDNLSLAQRYVVWTADYNFVMNGRGDLLSEVIPNEIGEIPIVDISSDKDFEFFVQQGNSLADFTIQYNAAWSDLLYIARMQGFSVGVLTGDPSLKPDNIFVGPSRLIFLPKNPANPDSSLSLDFKSPQPQIKETFDTIQGLAANYLSARGRNASILSSNNSGSKTFSSAIERLLAMIDDYKSTKEDFDLFKYAEKKIYKITVKWLTLLSGTELLDRKYWISQTAVNSDLNIQFHKPEMIETTSEKLDNEKKKIDLGISDRVSVLMDLEGLTEELAIEKIAKIDERRAQRLTQLANAVEVNDDETQS
jgi:hypothetical protein